MKIRLKLRQILIDRSAPRIDVALPIDHDLTIPVGIEGDGIGESRRYDDLRGAFRRRVQWYLRRQSRKEIRDLLDLERPQHGAGDLPEVNRDALGIQVELRMEF